MKVNFLQYYYSCESQIHTRNVGVFNFNHYGVFGCW